MGAIGMTRDQDLERRLADWLTEGPVTAPRPVLDETYGLAATRHQRGRVSAWVAATLSGPLPIADDARRLARGMVLAAILAALLLGVLLTAGGPFVGTPAPMPTLEPGVVLPVEGTRAVVSATEPVAAPDAGRETSTSTTTLELLMEDPRVSGTARIERLVEGSSTSGLRRWSGRMRLENADGAWQGTVTGAAFRDGKEVEYGWLTGSRAFEGYTFFYISSLDPGAPDGGTGPMVEGIVWPGEPPPAPDPAGLLL